MAETDFTAHKQCSNCFELKPKTDFFKASCCKDGLRGECKACVASKQARYNKENASKISERKKSVYHAEGADVARKAKRSEYYAANKERIKAKSRRRHTEKAAQISARRKLFRVKLNAQASKWRNENRDFVRRNSNAWYAANKDRLKPGRKAAKASRRSAGNIEAGTVTRLMTLQRGKCACCKVNINGKPYHLDHIFPLAKGGDNSKWNFQLLCPTCNMKKSAKHPIDFMQSRGFLL